MFFRGHWRKKEDNQNAQPQNFSQGKYACHGRRVGKLFRQIPQQTKYPVHLCGSADLPRHELLLSRDWGESEWRAYLWNYYRMTERVDAEIDRVLQALDASGLADNTLVLFTSDHGDGVASHRCTAKLSLYEEAVRIPFIIRWPKRIPAGRVDSSHLISQLDVLPTFCEVAGIPMLPIRHGQSLRTIIEP